MRLDRFLAECGFGTRSDVKKLIKSGRVTIAGEVAARPELQIDPETCEVAVDGNQARYREFVYLMMNKPAGYVSATWDKKLPTVIDLLPEEYLHFEPFPVGRLDIDTEGLLLLTNDGELCHRLLSPKKHITKTYVAEIEKPVSDGDIKMFEQGMDLGDFVTLPARLVPLTEAKPYFAEVTICEGKFHQVKRMFEKCDNKVIYLRRIKMKNLCIDEGLNPGEVRELTEDELQELKEN